MIRLALAAAIVGLTLTGCGQDLPGAEDPILTREDAIRYAPGVFNTSTSQGYTGPCIFDDEGFASKWVIAVDKKGGRPFKEVARTCRGYATGKVPHAVVMSSDGEIIDAR